MKYTLPLCLLALGAFAQTPAPQQAPKPAVPSPAPAPAPTALSMDPETVVAKMGAKSITIADVRAMLAKLPTDLQQAFQQNPKGAIQSLFLMEHLSKEASRANLATLSPYKEQIEMQRMQVLSQAVLTEQSQNTAVSEADLEKRFEADKSKYETAKIRAIYVGFADPKAPAPKPAEGEKPKPTLTEAEAKTKAEGIAKQARTGADFAAMAKADSDDKASGAKGGEFGTIRRGDPIPEEVKTAIFGLKAGGVSDPIKQGQGFFVIKVDELGMQKLAEVHDQLLAAMKQERFQEWMAGVQKQFEVTIVNEAYFGKPAVTPGMAPAPPGGAK